MGVNKAGDNRMVFRSYMYVSLSLKARISSLVPAQYFPACFNCHCLICTFLLIHAVNTAVVKKARGDGLMHIGLIFPFHVIITIY